MVTLYNITLIYEEIMKLNRRGKFWLPKTDYLKTQGQDQKQVDHISGLAMYQKK